MKQDWNYHEFKMLKSWSFFHKITHKRRIDLKQHYLFFLIISLYIINLNAHLVFSSFSTIPELTCRFVNTSFFKKVVSVNSKTVYYYKDFIYYPTYNSSYTQLVTRNTKLFSCFYKSSVGREFSRFVHVKDAFCTGQEMVAANGNYLFLNDIMNIQSIEFSNLSYEHLLFLYSPWSHTFGHFLQDCLPALLCIPQDIVNKSMIMVNFDRKGAEDWLSLFDISPSRIVVEDRWVHADNLYLYYQREPILASNIYSFQKVIVHLRKRLKVENIKATKYYIINKPPKKARYILNFDHLCKVVKQRFNQFDWNIEIAGYSNITKTSLLFAETKVLVSPSGSILMNSIFMKRNYTCGIIAINSLDIDYPNFGLGITIEIWQIMVKSFGFNHFSQIRCNIQKCITAITRVLYALEHQKWPKGTFKDMEEAFDLPAIFARARTNPYDVYDHIIDNVITVLSFIWCI